MLFDSRNVGKRMINGQVSSVYTLTEVNYDRHRSLDVTETELNILLLRSKDKPNRLHNARFDIVETDYLRALQLRYDDYVDMRDELMYHLGSKNYDWLNDSKVHYLEDALVQFGMPANESYVFIRLPLYARVKGMPTIFMSIKHTLNSKLYRGYLELCPFEAINSENALPCWLKDGKTFKWSATNGYADMITMVSKLLSRVNEVDIERLQTPEVGLEYYNKLKMSAEKK